MKNTILYSIITTLLLTTLTANNLSAQDNSSFFAIRSGVSIPFGGFSAENLTEGSYTQTGFNVTAESVWYFKPQIGIGALAGVNFHPVDVASLGRDKVAADHFLEDVFIRSESFLSIVAMAGPYYQYPVGKNFSLTGKLLCGLLYGQTPYQLYKPDFFGVSVPYYEITQAKDWKFAWLAGAALSYEISACVDLAFDADVMYNKLEFNFQTATDIRTEKRTFAIVNLTLGLRIKI